MVAAIPAAARALLSVHLEDLDTLLKPGAFVLTWVSLNIDGYLHRLHQVRPHAGADATRGCSARALQLPDPDAYGLAAGHSLTLAALPRPRQRSPCVTRRMLCRRWRGWRSWSGSWRTCWSTGWRPTWQPPAAPSLWTCRPIAPSPPTSLWRCRPSMCAAAASAWPSGAALHPAAWTPLPSPTVLHPRP